MAGVLDPNAVKALALAHSDTAIQIHRSTNPAATPGELARIGQEAAAQVFRAAVMGPPQPGMPASAFEAQMAQYGQLANAGDPTPQAISKLSGELVARAVEALKVELKPMSDKLDEIQKLAQQHDVAIYGGKVQRTKADGVVEVIEVPGLMGGKSTAPAASGAAPEQQVARGADGKPADAPPDAFGIEHLRSKSGGR